MSVSAPRYSMLPLLLLILTLQNPALANPKSDNLQFVESALTQINEASLRHIRGGGTWEYPLSSGQAVIFVPEDSPKGLANFLLVPGGVPPGQYDRMNLVVEVGYVRLGDHAQVADGYDFHTNLDNLKFPSGAQTGLKVMVDPPLQVVTKLSPELTLEADLSNTFVFNGPPSHAPGVKGIIFSPVIPVANTSTHGRITVKVVELIDNSRCADQVDPVPDATVTAIDQSGDLPNITATTDAQGDAWIKLLPGTYDILIEKAGYESKAFSDNQVHVANETSLGTVNMAAGPTPIVFDQNRATLLSVMMNIAYDLGSLQEGDALSHQTDPGGYVSPCWKYFRFIEREGYVEELDFPTLTQIFIGYNENNGDLVVGCRGTDFGEWKDVIDDASTSKVDWTRRTVGSQPEMIFDKAVHLGFREAYLVAQETLQNTLDLAIQRYVPDPTQSRIFFTGHSLGGALATLSALDLVDRLVHNHGYQRDNIIMYSFAAPRSITERLEPRYSSNPPSDPHYSSIVTHSFAVAAKDDPAPHFPGLDTGLGTAEYTHIHDLVVLSNGLVRGGQLADEHPWLGETRLEFSNGLPFEGCVPLPLGPVVGAVGDYGKASHDRYQYVDRIGGISNNIPDIGIFDDGTPKRLWLKWKGEAQGPCDRIALYATKKDDPPPTDAAGFVPLNGRTWAVNGDGYPDGFSQHKTGKNPNGLADQNKDFWVGYIDGFKRIIATEKWVRPSSSSRFEFADDGTSSPMSLRPSANPAHRLVTLQYSLPTAGAVRLAVYDVAGRKVRALIDETRGPGVYSERWDLRDSGGRPVTAGLYFLKLETKEQTLVQKVVVAR